MRAISTPASMGGIMLRDALTLMNDATNPEEATAVPLTWRSQGVLGLPNLYLSAEVSDSSHVSVVSSDKTNVHLNRGTEMILRLKRPVRGLGLWPSWSKSCVDGSRAETPRGFARTLNQ